MILIKVTEPNITAGSFVEKMMLKCYNATLVLHMRDMLRSVLDPILLYCSRINSKVSHYFKTFRVRHIKECSIIVTLLF